MSLWNTLRAPPLLAIVRFGEPQDPHGRDRRAWAQSLHEDVQQLRREKLISTQSRAIELLDLEGLQTLAHYQPLNLARIPPRAGKP